MSPNRLIGCCLLFLLFVVCNFVVDESAALKRIASKPNKRFLLVDGPNADARARRGIAQGKKDARQGQFIQQLREKSKKKRRRNNDGSGGGGGSGGRVRRHRDTASSDDTHNKLLAKDEQDDLNMAIQNSLDNSSSSSSSSAAAA